MILDAFSMRAFAPEWRCVALTQKSWRGELADLDFVFVESAWNGNNGQWQYQLTGSAGVKPDFASLMRECQRRGLPTVFWNKEDPPHFPDFLEAAKLFDVVLTSDVRLVPRYREELGHDRVGVLQFAAQPAVHNPERPVQGHASHDVAFAGMYFAQRYPERRQQMELLLGAALDVRGKLARGLEIFSRQLGGDDRYQFPAPFDSCVVGSLPYDQMLSAYKAFKVFLNVNSVVDSPSMCARRVFELLASGTTVISAPSRGIAEVFPKNEVFQPETREVAGQTIRAVVRSPELRERSVHLAQRRIWREHTYSHRAMAVMDAVGVEYSNPLERSASLLVSSNRPKQIEHVLTTVAHQCHSDIQLIYLAHGFELDELRFRRDAQRMGISDLVVLQEDSDITLGACLNIAAEAADGDVLFKIDDDDIYGDHYVEDQLAALRYSAADLVGKQAHYLYLTDPEIVMRRFPEREHVFTDLVMGPTMAAPREVFRDVRFSEIRRGEDTDFQRRLIGSGGSIYSADRFNFLQVRTNHRHTWQIDAPLLLANSDVHAFGYSPSHYLF